MRDNGGTKMEINIYGEITEAKLKSGGIRIVIEASTIDNLENLRHLIDKNVNIQVSNGQTEQPIEL